MWIRQPSALQTALGGGGGGLILKHVFHAIYSAAPIQKWIVASRALFLSHARLCEVVGVAYSYMHSLLFEYVTHVRIMMHMD